MGLCCRCFSGAAYSRFRVADDAVVDVDKTGLKQRCKRENDRGCVATWVGYQASASYCVTMQFGAAVDSLCLQGCGKLRVSVFQAIDLTVDRLLQPPCAAQ